MRIKVLSLLNSHLPKTWSVLQNLKLVFRKNQTFLNMSTELNLLKPPNRVFGMRTLDRGLFEKEIEVPCVVLENVKLSSIIPLFAKNYLLKLEHFKPIQTQNGKTVIHLNPEVIKGWADLGEETQDKLKGFGVDGSNFELRPFSLSYENFSVESIFRAVLPKDIEGFSSFTIIGHIVHVNLREHLVDFKELIGAVLFDKISGCRTVVNKVDMIDNTYRNFQMEILKGEDDMVTRVRENKCLFEFDFSKVYWNSRLCTEHERVVKMLQPDDVLFDVFAGVGPFSVPLAKKKCTVYANDLNPESFKWLNHNSKANKIDPKYFKSYNKDGKDFILEDIKALLPQYLSKDSSNRKVYLTMNLPALAVEFVGTFVGLYKESELEEFAAPPTVILYCFAKGEDYVNIAKELLYKHIGRNIEEKITDVFRVRTVSSMKEMMRVSFRLDRDILVGFGPQSCETSKRPLESEADTPAEDLNCKYVV